MTAQIRTVLPQPSPARFDRSLAIEARVADWAGLHTMLEWLLIHSPTPQMTSLANQWAEQLQAIMEDEGERWGARFP